MVLSPSLALYSLPMNEATERGKKKKKKRKKKKKKKEPMNVAFQYCAA